MRFLKLLEEEHKEEEDMLSNLETKSSDLGDRE